MKTIACCVMTLLMWSAPCPAQATAIVQKCGLPKVDRGDSTRPPEKNYQTDARFACYASEYERLEEAYQKQAAAQTSVLAELKTLREQNAALKEEAAKPVQLSVSGHAFDRKAFPDAACVAKATTTLNALGGTYLTNDASSVSFRLNSRFVLIECNGWPASVTVSGRDTATSTEASRIESLVFPDH